MRTRLFFLVVSFLAFVSAAHATLIIDVGTFDLSSDTTQTIAIYVTGGDPVEGLNFYLQVGDGGSANGGTDTTPIITNVDITGAGTFFAGNNTGAIVAGSMDQIWAVSTTTDSGTVSADGVLAYITVDTSGTTAGESYDLLLAGVAKGMFGGDGVATDFAGVGADIANGTINIVPEPASLVLLCSAGLPILRRYNR
jgi:uncharacterized protein with beta-barrel porin domain